MNQQERDDLREKHRRDGVMGCWTCQDYAWNDEYPCDVIKVLDAWDAVANTNPDSVSQGDQVVNAREERYLTNRAEELLLELIYERLLSTKPPSPDELGEPATERYKGYHEGWWDAIEALGNTIDSHNEGNGYRK